MQNVLKFPIWWWFSVTKKAQITTCIGAHCMKLQTMLIFLDSSTLLPGYKRGDVMKSIVCIFFNTYIDILKKEEKKTRCAKRAEISNLTSSLNYNLHRMKHQSQTQCYSLPFPQITILLAKIRWCFENLLMHLHIHLYRVFSWI